MLRSWSTMSLAKEGEWSPTIHTITFLLYSFNWSVKYLNAESDILIPVILNEYLYDVDSEYTKAINNYFYMEYNNLQYLYLQYQNSPRLQMVYCSAIVSCWNYVPDLLCLYLLLWMKDHTDTPQFIYLLTIQNHGPWNINERKYDTVAANMWDYGIACDCIFQGIYVFQIRNICFYIAD